MLPQIAKLYCVTIDDLFKGTFVVYENYAQRLASVYEDTRQPEDFISADFEFKKMMKNGNPSTDDLRTYGILHQYMMRYCIDKAIDLFDKVIAQENLDEALTIINDGSEDPEDWLCLIAAYRYGGDEEKAYEWFSKALPKFPNKAALYVYGGDACKNLKRYDKAYDMWLGIAHDLEKEGYEVEKKFPLELAEKCRKTLAQRREKNDEAV